MTTTLPIDQMIDAQRGIISRELFVAPELYREELESCSPAPGCSSAMRA